MKMRGGGRVGGVLAAALVLSCVASAGGLAAEPTRGADAFRNRLQAFVDSEVKAQEFPGLSAAIVLPDGETLAVVSGHADLDTREPLTTRHRMLAASIGKMFVATTALDLVAQGKLALDEPIARWFARDPWLTRIPNGQQLTLRLLLSHRTGIPNHVGMDRFRQAASRLEAAGSERAMSPLEILAFEFEQKPLFAPDTDYEYSDTNYIIAGVLIERVSGRSYYDQVRDRLLAPLGLRDTSPSDRRALERLANGYFDDGNNFFGVPGRRTLEKGRMSYHPGIEWTGGGLVSTPTDLARWAKLLFEGCALATPYLDHLFASGRTDSAEVPSRYGLGTYIYEAPGGRLYGHGGEIPGYSSSLLYIPDVQASLAVQVNQNVELRPTALKLVQLVRDFIDAPTAGRRQPGAAAVCTCPSGRGRQRS